MWVRGLKHAIPLSEIPLILSHPMWVRGLKQPDHSEYYLRQNKSHPMWVRGLKPRILLNPTSYRPVASYVGAWIETQDILVLLQDYEVASYVGAWIETS